MRKALLALSVGAGLAISGCGSPDAVAPAPAQQPDLTPLTRSAHGEVTGWAGETVRVELPGLFPGAYADVETRAVRSAADAGSDRPRVDFLCTAREPGGMALGAVSGWSISGEPQRVVSSQGFAMKATGRVIDASRVDYAVDVEMKLEPK